MSRKLFYILALWLGIGAPCAAQSVAMTHATPTPPQTNLVAAPLTERELSKVDVIASPSIEAQVNFSYSALTKGYGVWRSASLDVSKKFKPRQVVYGSARVEERGALRDKQLVVGAYQPLSRKWTFSAEASQSSTPHFLPKWTVEANLSRTLPNGWNVTSGVRQVAYSRTRATLTRVQTERYWGAYRAAYTLTISNLQSAGNSAGHHLQFNRYYGEQNSSWGVSAGFGRELESLGAGRVLRTDSKGVALSGRHWFSSRWGVNYALGWQQQGKLYTRREMSFGLRYRF